MKRKHIIITGGAWKHETFGGAYKVATEFAEYLSSQGHKVFYIAWSREAFFVNPTIHNNIEIWRYPVPQSKSPSPINAIGHIFRSWQLTVQIGSRYPVDRLNGHDFLQFLGALKALKGGGVKSSFSVHSPLVLENKAHWGRILNDSSDETGRNLTVKQRLALHILGIIEKQVYKYADVIQTDSRFTLNEISRDYGKTVKDKGFMSPLWVDLERFVFCEDKLSARKKLGGIWECNVPLFFYTAPSGPKDGC